MGYIVDGDYDVVNAYFADYYPCVADKPFHHGNLRAVLLAAAEQTLRNEGADALSLRQIARQAGVSHGAPRRHFLDRQALLDALAEQGFDRLTGEMLAVLATGTDDYQERFRTAAEAYVRFAIDDSALVELMFTTKNTQPPQSLQDAADRFFAAISDLIARGIDADDLQIEDPKRLQMLVVSTLQGIATLVASGRLNASQVGPLVADATTLFTSKRIINE